MINGLALCAGGGGLEAGLHLVMPDLYRTVCAVERQAYAAACLVEWMEKTPMGAPPVWDDIATFDPDPWIGIVDIISAGYPCQPFSLAGKQLGENDPRHIWPHVRRIIRAIMPAYVFCENVAAHLTCGFPSVKEDLEGLGYRVEAGIYAASHVGAPHLRERLFFLAELAYPGFSPMQTGAERPGRETGTDACRSDARANVADNQSVGRSPRRPEHEGKQWGHGSSFSGSGMAHSDGGSGHGRTEKPEREEEGRTAPGRGCRLGDPDHDAERPGLCAEQAQEFGFGRSCDSGRERYQNIFPNAEHGRREGGDQEGEGANSALSYRRWPWPAGRGCEQYPWEAPRVVESGMGRTAYGVGSRSEQLYMLGNGVLPVVGALAFVSLWEKLKRSA